MPSTTRQTRQTRQARAIVITNPRHVEALTRTHEMVNDALIINGFKQLVNQGFMRALLYRLEDDFDVEDCLTEQNSASFVDVVESYFNDYLNNGYVDMPNTIDPYMRCSEISRGILSLVIRQAFLQMVGFQRAQGRRVLYLADECYTDGESTLMFKDFRTEMNQRYL